MSTEKNRNYNCRNEELPVICGFSLYSLQRDLAEFTAYSPKFTEAYVTAYETAITEAQELVSPKSETAEMKKITDRMFTAMNSLLSPIQHLKGYLEMANGSISLSSADFSLADLRKGITARDPEKVIDRLREVNKNVARYKKPLADQGFNDELGDKFTGAYTSISNDRKLQYEMLSTRKAIVQGNVDTLNELYNQLQEICRVGKILYKGVDPVKLMEYTFTDLKKRVRRIPKPAETEGNKPEAETAVQEAAQ